MKNKLEYASLKKFLIICCILDYLKKILSEEYHPADEMKCPVHFCIGQEGVPSILKFFLKKMIMYSLIIDPMDIFLLNQYQCKN